MSEDIKQHVDTNSPEFNRGVEAGLNSPEDTKNWQAGNELGQELKDESEKKEPVDETPAPDPPTPLFLRDISDGTKGNAQDEKDKTEE
jgi:hypothetical protein